MGTTARTGGGEAGGRTAPKHHGNRHGRSEEARLAVLRAADDVLAEKGFAGVTIEGIAARAGVAKQTIYRWWGTKTEVLLEAFLLDVTEDLAPPQYDDVARDLRAHLRQLAGFLGQSDPGAVFRALLAHAEHDRTFAEEFRARFLEEQRDRDRLPLELAVHRGQLPADLDVSTETDQLVGPVYYRVLVTGEPVDEDFTDRLVDAFLQRVERG
ncbi:TetR/AcrR family transcriptional regulator [Streptomyces sp. ODS28]|uniref:TetR/AcrR family transcriptional regulator n=1 Tax=Streptomyces sp. ODS28 TaxID=3136688 RepID=UPI0031E92591